MLSRSEALAAVDTGGSRGRGHMPLEGPQVLRLSGNGGSGFQGWGSGPQGSEMFGMLSLQDFLDALSGERPAKG